MAYANGAQARQPEEEGKDHSAGPNHGAGVTLEACLNKTSPAGLSWRGFGELGHRNWARGMISHHFSDKKSPFG